MPGPNAKYPDNAVLIWIDKTNHAIPLRKKYSSLEKVLSDNKTICQSWPIQFQARTAYTGSRILQVCVVSK